MNKQCSLQASADITDNSVAKMCFRMIRSYVNSRFFFLSQRYLISLILNFVSFHAAHLTHL